MLVKKYFVPLVYLGIVAVMALVNYQPGTWLSGWDNLHPEFNFGLNIKRSIFSVWQEYQGLGTVGGLAYAADLPRQLFLWLWSWVLPASFLRYFWTFLMLWLGPAGVYYLIREIGGIREIGEKTAFLGGLFYLLNLITLQIFYVPFESFTTHFGFLPWLVLVFLKFLEKPSRKNLFWLGLVNLLATPQAYVPTVFLVYLGVLGVLGILKRSGLASRQGLTLAKAFLVVLAVNAFWLLPFLYFTLTSIKTPVESHMNWMATEDMYLQNRKFGNLENVVLGKGFLFDFVESGGTGQYTYLIDVWREHTAKMPIRIIGYSFFAIIIGGVFYSWKNKKSYFLPFFLLFIFSLSMLANDLPPFSWLNDLWRRVPIVNQVFRNPFTKFANLFLLAESIFFSWGVWGLKKLVGKYGRLIGILVIAGLLFISWPIFEGKLYYKYLKVSLPPEYFQLMDYFNNQAKTDRVAVLPWPSFWGWEHYRWGYLGSGFFWYGLKLPTMDRAFDGYSAKNENYYWEVSRAVYSQDLAGLESVLEKYQINWLVVDENILATGSEKSLYTDKLENMLGKSATIREIRSIGNIKVYGIKLQAPVKDFVFLADNLPEVGPEYRWNDEDTAYRETGNYFSKFSIFNFQLYYPFRSLFTGRKQEELEFKVEDKGNDWVISSAVTDFGGQLNLPVLNDQEAVFWTKDLQEEKLAAPDVQLKDGRVEVIIAKKKGYYSYDSAEDKTLLDQPVKSCDPFNDGWKKREGKEGKEGEEGKWRRFESLGSSNCLEINLPHLTQKTGYLVKIESRYVKGKPLLFYIVNKTSLKNVTETYLPKEASISYFIIPPMEEYGQGYSLNFDNISIGRQKTVNELGRVEVYPIQYRFLKELKLISNLKSQNSKPQKLKVYHSNPSWYEIKIDNETMKQSNNETIVLSQAYHSGWIAWEGKPFIGKKLEHVLVNNWENGWDINIKYQKSNIKNQLTIYIFFWPQALEYIGFGMMILALIFVLKYRKL